MLKVTNKRKKMFSFLTTGLTATVLAVAVLIPATVMHAATINYSGPDLGTWSNNANWTASTPGIADQARFLHNTTPPNITSTMNLPGHTIRQLNWSTKNSQVHTVGMGGNTLNVTHDLFVNNNYTESSGTSGAMIGGGTLNIGTAPGNHQVYIGRRNGNIGSASGSQVVRATLDLSGLDNFKATLAEGNFYVGVRSGGTGKVTGDLTLATNNQINANRLWISYGPSSDLINVPSAIHFGSGTNIVKVDDVRIAGKKGSATADIAVGGTFTVTNQVGGNANFRVGYNDHNTGTRALGSVDLSNASVVDMTLNQLMLGYKTGGGSGKAVGRMTLGALNTINANLIQMGRNDNGGATSAADQQRLYLGAMNDINVNDFRVGEKKSMALVKFSNPGGTLNLNGRSAARVANLRIGRNATSTGSNGVGVFDMSDGTVNAMITNMYVGDAATGGSNGSSTGTFIMGAGTVDVNTIILGNYASGNKSTGTFTQNGGTVVVNNRVRGDNASNAKSIATYNLAGGELTGGGTLDLLGNNKVDTFNWTGGIVSIENIDGNLNQTNAGTVLAPGNSAGLIGIDGDYNLDAGMLEIEIAGPCAEGGLHDHHFVDVSGDVVLDSVLKLVSIDGFVGQPFDMFQILTGNSITLGSNFSLDTSMFDAAVAFDYRLDLIDGINGQVLKLSLHIPEPASATLCMLGLGGLLIRRQRRAA